MIRRPPRSTQSRSSAASDVYKRQDHNELNLRTAQRQLNDARSRLTAARQDQENLSVYATEYGALEEQNIIGDEHRLDWIEGLEKLRRLNLAIDFRYNIAPQKIYAPQPAIDSGSFNCLLYTSDA